MVAKQVLYNVSMGIRPTIYATASINGNMQGAVSEFLCTIGLSAVKGMELMVRLRFRRERPRWIISMGNDDGGASRATARFLRWTTSAIQSGIPCLALP